MSLFSKYFGSSSDIEKKLEETYVTVFQMTMGMTLGQAKKHFQELFKAAKEESLKGKTKNLPQNYGDILLNEEKTNNQIKEFIAKKRKEGIKDKDIRWWWNMHDIERAMVYVVDENSKMALYIDVVQKSEADNLEKAQQEAAEKVRKFFPMYGDPDDTTHTKGDDRPLPFELKDRINVFIENQVNNIEEYKKNIENSSSFNALVRSEIRKGSL
jgi:Na+/phosphate symporter